VDYTKAAIYYKKACDGEHVKGCLNLGLLYAYGEGVSVDDEEAADLLERAGDGGEVAGCSSLGFLYAKGKGVQRDFSIAIDLYKKGCVGVDMGGCSNLGFMYVTGQGVEKDELKAAELFIKACDGGDMEGCSNLGNIYEKGSEIPRDERKAQELFRKACDGGYDRACERVEDPEKEKALRELCKKNLDGCMELAEIIFKKSTVESIEECKNLYLKVCDKGNNPVACLRFANILLDGGSSDDKLIQKKAYLYAKKACSRKNEEGCALVKALDAEAESAKVIDTLKEVAAAVCKAFLPCENLAPSGGIFQECIGMQMQAYQMLSSDASAKMVLNNKAISECKQCLATASCFAIQHGKCSACKRVIAFEIP
jgi:TPR repeat protein